MSASPEDPAAGASLHAIVVAGELDGAVLFPMLAAGDVRIDATVGHGDPCSQVASVLDAHAIDVVIALEPDDGLIARLKQVTKDVPLITLGGSTDHPDALPWPVDEDALLAGIGRAVLVRESEPAALDSLGLLGESPAMAGVREVIERVAERDTTILIRGETGSGKSLVAKAIHERSPRRDGPLITVHCGALPESLLESELFGYEKGAFTGAASRRIGRIEQAQGGTLFLDEIGDVSLSIQVKLLRVLQEREFERLGGNISIVADVRFLSATHRDLESMVRKGMFREDLFYRLNVVPAWVPPLRARQADIATLATMFCDKFSAGGQSLGLSEAALERICSERWPGNVRQLQNFMERLVVLSDGPIITEDTVARELSADAPFVTHDDGREATLASVATAAKRMAVSETSEMLPLAEEVRAAERRAILRALRRSKGDRKLAARLLGIARATLYKKLKQHRIERSVVHHALEPTT